MLSPYTMVISLLVSVLGVFVFLLTARRVLRWLIGK